MRSAIATVRDWSVAQVEGDLGQFNAASLVKQVVGHIALEVIEDLDDPIHWDITTRHVLSHTTGLPNWRPRGEDLAAIRPPGTRWGYSGEGFVLLQSQLELETGEPIDQLAQQRVFEPLGMRDSRLDDPEPGFHGYRPLLTTAADYGAFLAHVLTLKDERWLPQRQIDDELAWGAGWGLELGPPVFGWQWGANENASNFVIGCPSTGSGVVVLTDSPDARDYYRAEVEHRLPGDHPALRVEYNTTWLELFT